MFLKNGGSNGWRGSGPPGYLKLKKTECILISINMAIAWTTETAKFRKLKKWQHLEVNISIFLVFFVLWVVQENRKIYQSLKSVVHAIKVHPVKISSKFQVNRSIKTWDIPIWEKHVLLPVVQKYSRLQSIEQYKK